MKNTLFREIKPVVVPAKCLVWGPRLADRWWKIHGPKGEVDCWHLSPLKNKDEPYRGVSISGEMVTLPWEILGICPPLSGLTGICVSVWLSLFPRLEMVTVWLVRGPFSRFFP